MAGVKGRSGGARPNTGGKRPGSGRPKKEDAPIAVTAQDDPIDFLRSIMNNVEIDGRLRVDAAKALMPYLHQRKGDKGKKEERAEKAKAVSSGRFAPAAPPSKIVGIKR
jgi:phage terminase small subunit